MDSRGDGMGGSIVNGVWLPNEVSLGTKINAAVEQEAESIAEWCRRWPKGEIVGTNGRVKPAEPKLGGGDVQSICLVRSQMGLWERSFSEQVLRRVMEKLELVRPKPVGLPQPDNRQNRRATSRAALRTAEVGEQRASNASDPQGGDGRTEFDRKAAERQRVHEDPGGARPPHSA